MKKRLLTYGVCCVVVGLLLINQHRRNERISHANDVMRQQVAATVQKSLSGNYLAARFATGNDDLRAAAEFYNKAIAVATEKEILQQRALPAAIGGGDIDAALTLARKMDLKQKTANAQLAVMMLLVDAFKQNDQAEIARLLPLLRDDGFGRLLTPLLAVWADVAQDKTDQALLKLDALEKTFPSVRSLVNVQKAFIYEIKKQSESAEAFYKKSLDDNLSLRSAWIIGRFYERQKDPKKAAAIYKKMAERMPESALPQLAMMRLETGGDVQDAGVQKIQDGVASAFYDVASVLFQEGSPRLSVLYAQLAYDLAPQDPFVNVLLGDIFATSNAKILAEDFYQQIEKNSDLWLLAQFRLAALYETIGQSDQALHVLESVSKNPLSKRQALTEIADLYRRAEQFKQALPYYDQVIALIHTPQESDWPLYYARAICNERLKNWDKAEADLKQALVLSPNQPEVLNYLAYTWVDHGVHLKKALRMLQQASAAAPQDPYITDSLGWAYYRLGRFKEAVSYLEAAVEGLPDDATVNDHLGDAYWRVGRTLEAQFQWKRSLKNVGPMDDELANTIRMKLRKGLPALEKDGE